MSWAYTGTILTCTHQDCKPEVKQNLDLTLLFPDFATLDEPQQMTVVYGVKQKCADACARSKDMTLTSNERQSVIEETYTRIAVERKWNAEREAGDRISVKKVAEKAEGMDLTDDQRALLTKLGILK